MRPFQNGSSTSGILNKSTVSAKFKIKSGFDKRYLQKFLATISFEACSVLDHSCLRPES